MKIRIPKFIRKMVCKYVAKVLFEETGIQMDICIDDARIETAGLNYRIHMAETIDINKKDFKQFVKKAIKNEL